GFLIWKFCEDLDCASASEAAKSYACSFGNVTFQPSQLLCPAERLNVFVQNLAGRRRALRLGDSVIHFIRRGTVYVPQSWRGQGFVAAAVAAPAGNHLPPGEIIAIDCGHHQYHLARNHLSWGVRGPIHFYRAGSDM